MKESIGSTASLNIVFVFIAIIFAFLAASLSYYKAFKVNNIISNSILKYEGYNALSSNEIDSKLNSIGYQRYNVNCPLTKEFNGVENDLVSDGENGICVYLYSAADINNTTDNSDRYYQYNIITYMTINLPVVGELIKIPVKTTTDEIYGCYANNDSYTINGTKINCN